MITTFYGYLEAAYLVGPYLSDLATGATHSQLGRSIVDSFTVSSQLSVKTGKTDKIGAQIGRKVNNASASILQQIDQNITSNRIINLQMNRGLSDSALIASQIDQKTVGLSLVPQQIDRLITDDFAIPMQLNQDLQKTTNIASQLQGFLTGASKTTGQEMGRGPISHQSCGGYLLNAYLTEPYLAPFICAHMGQQLDRKLAKTFSVNSQLDRKIINASKVTRSQLKRQIIDDFAIKMQLLRTSSYKLNSQLLFAIYNTTNLRILCDFPSRGTSGTNWTVVAGGTAGGDRNVNNLNTDIVEQVYRSVSTTITIQCDTQISQGIFNDTVAILGHNFGTSASVTMQGSNDLTFSSIPISETLFVETENMYWISEYLPLTSYRYWRFIISDPTNKDGFIEIGTIIFGASIIFNGECFTDQVVRRKTHFADRIRTEGFSSVSNDRALKRAVSLSFRKLNYLRENYRNLVSVVDTARTSLKCLWIPTPQYASRFAVFGKLSEIPVENHQAISETADYIDMDVNVDEAL
jgi:hypothetical protein